MSKPWSLNYNLKHDVTYLLDCNVSVVLSFRKKKTIKHMCSIVDLFTFLYNSLLYLFKYIIQVIHSLSGEYAVS